MTANPLPSRPLALGAIAITGVLASGLLGATTNAVNGRISPLYFVRVLGWHEVRDVGRASIAQGALEGLLFGVGFSLLFTTVTGIITGAACSYRFAVGHLLGILAGAYVGWALGGLAAVGLANFDPAFYHATFRGVPADPGLMLRDAWVGGSILGAELGGLMAVVLGLVVLRANWRRRSRGTSPDGPTSGWTSSR